MARCPCCGKDKSNIELDAQGNYCKPCHAENSRRYRSSHTTSAKSIKRISEWKRTDRGKLVNRLKTIRYRARKMGAEGSHTQAEWLALVGRYLGRCALCGVGAKMTRDHVIPLSKGGSDYISNIQPLCNRCNARKNDKILSAA